MIPRRLIFVLRHRCERFITWRMVRASLLALMLASSIAIEALVHGCSKDKKSPQWHCLANALALTCGGLVYCELGL
ncbi:MAG: hypothetical protein WCJ40_17455 [Planctomycetota bacterium]